MCDGLLYGGNTYKGILNRRFEFFADGVSTRSHTRNKMFDAPHMLRSARHLLDRLCLHILVSDSMCKWPDASTVPTQEHVNG